jgi:ferredoxin
VSKPLRIRLDRTLCDGFGVCAKHAPEYFSLDDWGYASLIGDGTVPEADRDAVMRALLDCPVHAIIAMGEHQPSGRTRPSTNSEQPTDPRVENPNSEAISEFVR